jgi:hypothetical protein
MALPAPGPAEYRANHPGAGHDREQRARRVPAAELVVPQECRQRLDRDRIAAPVALALARGERQGDAGRISGIGGLELPPRDRRDVRRAVPRQREQPGRVAQHRQRDRERLLGQDAQVEVVGALLGRLAGRRPVTLVWAVGAINDLVDSPRRDRRRRAQRAFTSGKAQSRAIGGDRGPPVQDVGPPRGQGEPVTRQHRNGHVAGHRDGEARGGHAQVTEPAPPAPGHQDGEDHRRDDKQLTHLPHVSGQAQHQGTGREAPHRWLGFPEQDGEPGEDEGFEGDVGHDGLFCLELVGVQEEGGGGEGGGPAGGAAAGEGGVQGQGHGQAEQVLEAGHHGQVPHPQQRLEQDVVASRVIPAGAGQVLVRVDVEQSWPVSQLGDHPHAQPGRQHDHQQPVPPHGAHEGPGTPSGGGRVP